MTATIISTALGAFGAYQQYESAREAEKMGEQRYSNIMDETAENKRREMAQNRALEADARARAAASGVKISGSPQRYLTEQRRQHQLGVNWMDRAGRSRAEIAKQEGESAASQAKAGALSTLARIPSYWV